MPVFNPEAGAGVTGGKEAMKQADKKEKAGRDASTARRGIPSRSELKRQVTELAEQRAAISEVLHAIANSPHDLQPIFDTILANATRLCRAHLGALLLFEENDFHVVARRAPKNSSPDALPLQRPLGLRPNTPLSRLAKTRTPIHDADLAADQSYLDRDLGVVIVVESLGARTSLLVPMLKEDELIGAITILRTEVQPFTQRQIDLIADFAAQATIALESTRRERQYREVNMDLAHATRVATIGQLTASIAHELKQPISAIAIGGEASLRWLTRQPPEIEEAKQSVEAIIKDANRARDVIDRIHSLVTKNPARNDSVDINTAILEVTALTHSEAVKNGVAVRTQLADHLSRIEGDRVQLQQVVLNLILNAIQAMSELCEGIRELHISTENVESEGVCVAVRDSGPGLNPENLRRLFEPFYTTKSNGMGMGLSICRRIVEGHGGRLWATGHASQGALFRFTIPGPTDVISQ
jgi:C4-dicarboxylate-specific signal transduction histidine kinase